MLGAMWPWQKPKVAPDSFSGRVQRVEADCLRRLEFVETQLGRALRQDHRWDSHMTVVDADIEPVGTVTHVFSVVSDVHAWPWWMYAAVGVAALAVIIALISVA